MNIPHTSLEFSHFPVMIKEVIKICSPKSGNKFLDCTFGAGNYTKALLKFSDTQIIALDRDKTVIKTAEEISKRFVERFTFYHTKFSKMDQFPINNFDAVIFDLGISSMQLNDLSRGFSFKSKDKLDMSMGLSSVSIENIINTYQAKDLINIIKTFGEEREAKSIVNNIIKQRKSSPIKTTDELVKIIKISKRKNFKKKIDVSTKTFQALRIIVNKEITELIKGLIEATKILKPGGKLILITFHSIEDKIVKYYFKNYSENFSRQNKYRPESANDKVSLFRTYKNKVIRASQDELTINPRSRSAKLRFATRNENIFYEPKELKLKFKRLTDLENKHD